MDPIPEADGSPVDPLPEGEADPAEQQAVEDQEDGDAAAPISAPDQDLDATEKLDNGRDLDEEARDDAPEDDDDDKLSESDLSEIDEEQFQDFDPQSINIEERPTAVDESNVNLIGRHKRKKAEGEDGERKKKNKDKKRAKRTRPDDDDDGADGQQVEGKRPRKRATQARERSPEPTDEQLTPEERRRRAFQKRIDEALKPSGKRRSRKGEVDLEAQQDELIENMRQRMTNAARIDNEKRQAGQPATEKLRLLPEVVGLLNRNTLWRSICDPDTNLLEAVKFFLEPLSDASMPAFNIQRELFSALVQLPMTKDALLSSGLGKLVLFYTKSKWVQDSIKRQADRLVGEWTRLVTNRTDDYRKRELVTADYNPALVVSRADDRATIASEARARKLAIPQQQNRARIEGGPMSYTIAPRNVVSSANRTKQYGKAGDAAFNRIKNRNVGGRG